MSTHPFSATFTPCVGGSSFNIWSERHFRLRTSEISRFFQQTLPPRLEDLLRIAMCVYVMDRLTRRRQRENQGAWARDFNVTIGVNDREFWASPAISQALHETLEYLSGDFWNVSFAKDEEADARGQQWLFSHDWCPESPLICLYSGGLDSAAGLAQLAAGANRRIIPVTIHHQPNQRLLVRKQLAIIQRRTKAEISHLMVKAALFWNYGLKKVWEEPTQRSRSFLFMAVGAAAALLAGAREVQIFESGIGSLNIPLMAGMVGSMSTRSCHPRVVDGMSTLTSLVAGRDLRFVLPFADRTKADLLRWIGEHHFADLARMTVSCASYPVRFGKQKVCGVCPSCIFRRQAMVAAGVTENGRKYKYDLFSDRANNIPSKKLVFLRAFLMQAAQLRAIGQDGTLPRPIQTYLVNSGITDGGVVPPSVMNLLDSYRQDWITFAKRGAERGTSWSKLLLGSSTEVQGVSHA
jgi:7-cyano-7-deazaguanine synthase in queuosine biosynthesis